MIPLVAMMLVIATTISSSPSLISTCYGPYSLTVYSLWEPHRSLVESVEDSVSNPYGGFLETLLEPFWRS